MIRFPKVRKGLARAASGGHRVWMILSSMIVTAGISGAVVAGGGDAARAATVPQASVGSSEHHGALVFAPVESVDGRIAYHQSHRSHMSHQSHRSHYSHYSSR